MKWFSLCGVLYIQFLNTYFSYVIFPSSGLHDFCSKKHHANCTNIVFLSFIILIIMVFMKLKYLFYCQNNFTPRSTLLFLIWTFCNSYFTPWWESINFEFRATALRPNLLRAATLWVSSELDVCTCTQHGQKYCVVYGIRGEFLCFNLHSYLRLYSSVPTKFYHVIYYLKVNTHTLVSTHM